MNDKVAASGVVKTCGFKSNGDFDVLIKVDPQFVHELKKQIEFGSTVAIAVLKEE